MLAEGRAWCAAGDHPRARECLEPALTAFVGPVYEAERENVVAELALLAAR